jgi:hypothetical protein
MFLSYEALKRHHIDTKQQREREEEREEKKNEKNEKRAKKEFEIVIMKFFYI